MAFPMVVWRTGRLAFLARRVRCQVFLLVGLGASSSLSMCSNSGRKSLVSMRLFGCRPMSAWALLDV
eukprot:scaffold127308_cov36-Tisochrysis_lutea.AAC.6